MAGRRRPLSTTLKYKSSEPFSVNVVPCDDWEWEGLVPEHKGLIVRTTHHPDPSDYGAQPIGLIAELLAGGPCFFLRPEPGEALPQTGGYVQLHKLCSTTNGAGVVDLKEGEGSLFLLALKGSDPQANGAAVPVFGAWHMSVKSSKFLARQVLDPRRLPVVLGLDSTLLHAVSQRSLEDRLQKLRGGRRDKLEAAAAAAPTPESERSARGRLAGLRKEEALLTSDKKAMDEYLLWETVTLAGRNGERISHPVQQEAAVAADKTRLKRPVVRLEDGARVLTMIDPGKRQTAMLMRIRPDWRATPDGLRTHLEGVQAGGLQQRRKYYIYVCTAAERGYALEAWRVLDANSRLLPLEEADRRLKAGLGTRPKELHSTLGLPPPPTSLAGRLSAMPLAVIADAKPDAWEAKSREQLLQVEPFDPYQEAFRRRAPSDTMARLIEDLANLRSHVFYEIDANLKPAVLRLKMSLLDLSRPGQHYRELVGERLTIARLIKNGKHRVHRPTAGGAAGGIPPADPRTVKLPRPPFCPTPVGPSPSMTHAAEAAATAAPVAKPKIFFDGKAIRTKKAAFWLCMKAALAAFSGGVVRISELAPIALARYRKDNTETTGGTALTEEWIVRNVAKGGPGCPFAIDAAKKRIFLKEHAAEQEEGAEQEPELQQQQQQQQQQQPAEEAVAEAEVVDLVESQAASPAAGEVPAPPRKRKRKSAAAAAGGEEERTPKQQRPAAEADAPATRPPFALRIAPGSPAAEATPAPEVPAPRVHPDMATLWQEECDALIRWFNTLGAVFGLMRLEDVGGGVAESLEGFMTRMGIARADPRLGAAARAMEDVLEADGLYAEGERPRFYMTLVDATRAKLRDIFA